MQCLATCSHLLFLIIVHKEKQLLALFAALLALCFQSRPWSTPSPGAYPSLPEPCALQLQVSVREIQRNPFFLFEHKFSWYLKKKKKNGRRKKKRISAPQKPLIYLLHFLKHYKTREMVVTEQKKKNHWKASCLCKISLLCLQQVNILARQW